MINFTALYASNPHISLAWLAFLQACEDKTPMTTVAKAIKRTSAAATGLSDRLFAMGYITREEPAYDRRKILVQITPKGQEYVRDAIINLVGTI